MELSLDLGLGIPSKPVSEFLGEVSKIGDGFLKLSMIEDFVKRLELEMRKIDGFKRELPLCMLLLNDAIGRLKEEAMQCGELNNRSGVKRNVEEDGIGDKRNWMSSVQLWNSELKKQDAFPEAKLISEKEHKSAPENPIQTSEGAFTPYKVQSEASFPLMNPISEFESYNSGLKSNNTVNFGSENQNQAKLHNKPQHHQEQQQNLRKQRRCWSPDLHRRFVDALHKLGGSQVATPKQIRELMGVEGLTNDEVKSHLQKYRLHIRKLPSGSRWSDPGKGTSSQSGSPLGPLLAGSGTGGNSMEGEEDEKSDGQSWRYGVHKGGEIVV